MFHLTEEDIRNAMELYEMELIDPINKGTMFLAGVYCILSICEKHEKYTSVFDRVKEKFHTPEDIINNRSLLRKVIKPIIFPNRKAEYLYKFSVWWKNTDLPEEIIEDIQNGRKREFELRDEIAEEAPGMSYKNASFFLNKCGYVNVVPIDLWELRLLEMLGHNVEVSGYYEIKGGLRRKEYLKYENIIREIARSFEVTPVLFHFTIWNKYRNLKKNNITKE